MLGFVRQTALAHLGARAPLKGCYRASVSDLHDVRRYLDAQHFGEAMGAVSHYGNFASERLKPIDAAPIESESARKGAT